MPNPEVYEDCTGCCAECRAPNLCSPGPPDPPAPAVTALVATVTRSEIVDVVGPETPVPFYWLGDFDTHLPTEAGLVLAIGTFPPRPPVTGGTIGGCVFAGRFGDEPEANRIEAPYHLTGELGATADELADYLELYDPDVPYSFPPPDTVPDSRRFERVSVTCDEEGFVSALYRHTTNNWGGDPLKSLVQEITLTGPPP